MEMFKLQKWLCGIVMMFALVFITSQVSFAEDEFGEEFGIVRYKIPSTTVTAQGLRALDKMATNSLAPVPVSDADIQLFSTFSTDIGANGEVAPTLSPALLRINVYLYVAFRVKKATKVDIKWKVDGTEVKTITGFVDPVVGGNLSPGYWYYAWYKAPASGVDKIAQGLRTLQVSVKTPNGVWDVKQDSCTFLVVN